MTQREDQPLKSFQELQQRQGGQPTGQGKAAGQTPRPQQGQAHTGNPAGWQPQGGLPAQYLQTLRSGYFDQHGYIREAFIVEYPIDIAGKLEAGGMTRSLLRTFYGEVSDVKHLLRGGRLFEALRPRILKLEAFATNATNRRTNRAPQMFQSFIAENVRIASQDADSFLDGFSQHFECVVLYFKGRR
ncbi:MAG: hypothetical protein V1724_03170 [Chloroflexota bacterium]